MPYANVEDLRRQRRERRKKWLEAGLCRDCGQPQSRSRHCERCLIRNRRTQRAAFKRKIEVLIQQARSKPCTDCGAKLPPSVMNLDHVRGVKKFNLQKNKCPMSLKQVIEEIAKCDPRCPNCHGMRHYAASSS